MRGNAFKQWSGEGTAHLLDNTQNLAQFIMPAQNINFIPLYKAKVEVVYASVRLSNNWGRNQGAFDVVLEEKISIAGGMTTYMSLDSLRIDFQTVNNLQRETTLTTIIRSTNGARYIAISESEYSIVNSSTLIEKANSAVDDEMDLSLSKYFLAKLGNDRGYAIVYGEVNPESTISSDSNTGDVILEYYHFTE